MATAIAADFDHRGLAETARRTFIVPGYARLASSLADLRKRVAMLCASPDEARLATVRAAYRGTIAAWGGIEMITFGPVARNNRLDRIFFWPDRKGIGQRQIRRLLAARDGTQIEPERLAHKSIALQGLTALEVVLHGDGAAALAAKDGGAFRCNYAEAITANLATIVARIQQDWRDDGAFTRLWREPGPANPVYLRPQETTLELVKAFQQMLEAVRDQRIAPAIGFGSNRRMMRPVLWRSRLSMVLIHADIVAARKLFLKGGLAGAYIDAIQGSAQARGHISSLTSEFDIAVGVAAKLASMEDPFALPSIRGNLTVIGFPLKTIRTRAVGLIKQAANLSVGFNASDGD